ncbi:MAG: NUDIX hydrolase [Oscillibacter sp.]|nr:NUDIX hydrolase [Oscillibacter sp.]
MNRNEQWLQWAVELQSLAQAGLHYSKDPFDVERFQRVREIAAEMLHEKSGIPAEKVRELFCAETGYQTPKLDTRAAIFRDDKILLVRERRTGNWSLPGGWVDVNLSVMESAVKEVREEAGLEVSADLVIAVQDREKHNQPVYAWKLCKIFVLCTAHGGQFEENTETTESGYFPLDALPPLSTEKNTPEQIAMCFDAHRAEHWKTLLD